MPLFSEPPSVVKSRFGSLDQSAATPMDTAGVTMSSVKSTPNLRMFKSAAKDNRIELFEKKDVVESSRSFEFREDPSFWKDHNVQVITKDFNIQKYKTKERKVSSSICSSRK